MATIKNYLFSRFKIFNHEVFGALRILFCEDTLYFVGKDAATALGYSNPTKAVRQHVSESNRKVAYLPEDVFVSKAQNGLLRENGAKTLASGVKRHVHTAIISEAGLYELVLGSKLPEAGVFKAWVTGTVLPALRANGHYFVAQEDLDDDAGKELLRRGQELNPASAEEYDLLGANDLVIGPGGILMSRADALAYDAG